MCKHFGDERIAISFWNRVARRKRHVKIACVNEAIESVHQGVLRWFSDLASAENSVKKRTQFFSLHKTGTRSSKFVFYGFIAYNSFGANYNFRLISLWVGCLKIAWYKSQYIKYFQQELDHFITRFETSMALERTLCSEVFTKFWTCCLTFAKTTFIGLKIQSSWARNSMKLPECLVCVAVLMAAIFQ